MQNPRKRTFPGPRKGGGGLLGALQGTWATLWRAGGNEGEIGYFGGGK